MPLSRSFISLRTSNASSVKHDLKACLFTWELWRVNTYANILQKVKYYENIGHDYPVTLSSPIQYVLSIRAFAPSLLSLRPRTTPPPALALPPATPTPCPDMSDSPFKMLVKEHICFSYPPMLLSPDSWLSCFSAEALLSVYLAFYVVSKLGLVPSCICKIFALKRQQHVYFWYFQCWPEDAGRLETFDGVVGEEACRYGPHYFIIAGSMQGLWGWQGRVKLCFVHYSIHACPGSLTC